MSCNTASGSDCNLPKISIQKANDFLKEIGKLAKIDTPTETVRYQGAKRIENIVPKWELITTHTGRRTFITLSLDKGMSPVMLREVSGHKDIRSFNKYVKLSDDKKRKELLSAWGQ